MLPTCKWGTNFGKLEISFDCKVALPVWMQAKDRNKQAKNDPNTPMIFEKMLKYFLITLLEGSSY